MLQPAADSLAKPHEGHLSWLKGTGPVLSALSTGHKSAADCSPGLPSLISSKALVEQCMAFRRALTRRQPLS